MADSAPFPIVLLVEDSEDDVFFFRHALKKTGVPCALFHVADGAAALDYFKTAIATPADPAHPWPDFVFLDLKLPTFSGFEILAWLREQPLPRPLEVTILSGSEHASDIARAKALGAAGYLVKPIAAVQLQARIGRANAPRASSHAA